MSSSPRSITRLAALACALGAASLACEDGHPVDPYEGPIDYATLTDDPAVRGPFHLRTAYVEGEPWQYFELGAFEAIPGTMYVPTFGGQPLTGQWPIVDRLPGDEGYSPFWRVVEVEVPGDYRANRIKSWATLEGAGFIVRETDAVLYCPVVDPDGGFFDPEGRPLRVFPGTGEAITNPFVGAFDPRLGEVDTRETLTREADGLEEDLVLQPIWHETRRGFCLDPHLTRRYRQAPSAAGGAPGIDPGRFGRAVVQLQAGEAPTPWPDLAPVFERGADSPGFHPVVRLLGEVTVANGQRVELRAFEGYPDFDDAAPLDVAQRPVIRRAPDPADLPRTE